MEALIREVKQHFTGLLDSRKGRNTRYAFAEVCMAAYSLFHMQSPSFLAHQDRLNKKYASHNGYTLFGFKHLPSDNQIRTLMDEVKPEGISGLSLPFTLRLSEKSF